MTKQEVLNNIYSQLVQYNNDYVISNIPDLDYIQMIGRTKRVLITIEVTKYPFNIFLIKTTYFGMQSLMLNYNYILSRKSKNNFKLLKKWTN